MHINIVNVQRFSCRIFRQFIANKGTRRDQMKKGEEGILLTKTLDFLVGASFTTGLAGSNSEKK